MLLAIDLERNQIKFTFTHPSALSFPSIIGFNIVTLTINVKYISFPNKINFHRKTGELIYNDLSKTSLAENKAKSLLGKLNNHFKLEKVES